MRLLLHACCAPCLAYPLKELREEGTDVMGYFYPHNIHPYTEAEKRKQALKDYASTEGLPVIYAKGYEIESFFRNTAFRESQRCRLCYYDRLIATALVARKGRFDAFGTTLLYSKFQKHDLVREIGKAIAEKTGIPFYYRDWRRGWREGIEMSKKSKMYRQQYCGCLFSEKERYYRGCAG